VKAILGIKFKSLAFLIRIRQGLVEISYCEKSTWRQFEKRLSFQLMINWQRVMFGVSYDPQLILTALWFKSSSLRGQIHKNWRQVGEKPAKVLSEKDQNAKTGQERRQAALFTGDLINDKESEGKFNCLCELCFSFVCVF